MKRFTSVYALLAATMLVTGGTAFAADTPTERPAAKADAVRPKPAGKVAAGENKLEGLIRPELVIKNAQQLGVTQDQLKSLRQEVQANRQKLQAMQETLQTEMTALNGLLAQPQIDQKAAVAQLDRVLDAEREIKRSNLSMALSIMGQLTLAQREQALALMKDSPKAGDKAAVEKGAGEKGTGDAQKEGTEALRAKMQEVQALAKKRQAEGHDIQAAKKLVESVRPLVQEGKMEEAEKALDDAKHMLE
jgi:hypothetical protein